MTTWQGPTVRSIVTGLILSLVLVTGCQTTPPEPTPPQNLTINLAFVSKWWSVNQMDGMNTDDPPPKNTDIELDRWDASDPVGTPHPNEFDIVALVGNVLEEKELWFDVAWRWSIGSLSEPAMSQWTPWESGDRTGPLTVMPDSENRTVLQTVQIGALQQKLFEQGQWPWVFEARAVVTSDGDADHASTTRSLDILAAD